MTRIKDWRQFQHYKHRNPPWIRLYRELLNDREWFALDGDACKVLVMCWLVASENDGELPSDTDLAFRFRMPEKQFNAAFAKLSHWLEHDASNALADRLHDATTETETETESDISIKADKKSDWPEDFRERFWQAYPRKVGKKAAIRKLEAIENANEVSFDRLLSAIGKISATEEKFIPHPTTWLNQGRYLDGEEAGKPVPFTKVFVPVDTPAWELWTAKLKAEGRRPPETGRRVDGTIVRGWFFESQFPPGEPDGAAPLS
jgi:hypothetical protein